MVTTKGHQKLKENKAERITKSIRLSPNIDKDMSLFCRLANKSQADYINEVIANDLSRRTLKRSEFENKIIINLPTDPAEIEKCIVNKTDLVRYNNADAEKIVINLNNYLDAWQPQGTYSSPFGFDKHSGLIILNYNDNSYYIYFQFKHKVDILGNSQAINTAESDFINISKNFEDLQNNMYNLPQDRDILLNFVYLIDKTNALFYSELAKNNSLIDNLKNDKPIENKIVTNNPVTKVDIKQQGLARELEYTKNQLREVERQKDVVIDKLHKEIKVLEHQRDVLLKDNERLDKAIADAVNIGYEKGQDDIKKYIDEIFKKYGIDEILEKNKDITESNIE